MGEANDPLRVERATLDSGLIVARQAPPPGTQSTAITYVGPGGWAFDPPGRAGVSALVASLVVSGAGQRDRLALARELDRLGATLGAHPAPESIEVTIWGPASEWERLFGLLADAVQRPRLDPDDLARVRRQLSERQLRELEQPADRCERELLHAIFPTGHPYRETGVGDRASVGRIRRADLVRFHQNHFSAEGARLIGTLPAPLAEFARAAKRGLDGLAARPPDAAPSGRVKSPSPRPREQRITLPGRSQVEVRIGGPSIARADPEYSGAFLAEQVLGGRTLLSRLFQHIREAEGLAYHASSELEAMRWGGYWTARAGTGPDRLDRVVQLLRAEVDRISEERIPADELALIRESTLGELPLELETTAGAHELAVDVAYNDLPDDHYRTWPATLRALRPAEIQHAAERAFDPHASVLVVAGPPSPRGGRDPRSTRTHTHK